MHCSALLCFSCVRLNVMYKYKYSTVICIGHVAGSDREPVGAVGAPVPQPIRRDDSPTRSTKEHNTRKNKHVSKTHESLALPDRRRAVVELSCHVSTDRREVVTRVETWARTGGRPGDQFAPTFVSRVNSVYRIIFDRSCPQFD